MAQRLDVTFKHAIFDTYSYQRGAQPQFIQENKDVAIELQKFLDSGDSVLDDKPGYFLGSIADQFVIAFEQQRSARRGTENYFDLFWTPVSNVSDVSVKSTVKELTNELAPGFNGPVQKQVKKRVKTRSAAVAAGDTSSSSVSKDDKPTYSESTSTDHKSEEDKLDERSEDDSSDESDFVDVKDVTESDNSGAAESDTTQTEKDGPNNRFSDGLSNWDWNNRDHQQNERVSTEFIARFWEYHRRSDEQLRATLDDIDRFGLAVDGTLREFSYISHERVENVSFDIVSGPFLGEIETNGLEETIDNLRQKDALSVSNLPTYRDIVEGDKEQNYACLSDPQWLQEDVQELTDILEQSILTKFDHTTQRAADVFKEAFENKTVTSDREEKRIPDSVTNIAQELTGSKEPDLPVELKSLDSDTFDEELQTEIIEALDFGTIDDSLYQTKDELISDLESELDELVQETRIKLVHQIIQSIDQIRQTDAYDRSNRNS